MGNKPYPLAMRDTFFNNLHGLMEADPSIFVLSADFGAPTLDAIRDDYPERFINVGIAEQNLIAVAAGLALEGHKVVCYAIAPFITMRCYEQIRVNLAILSHLRPMSVTLLGVGAGMSYEVSGPTHHCIEDISIMSALPGVQVWSPSDAEISGILAKKCTGSTGIHYIRCDAKPQPPLPSIDALDVNRGFRHIMGGGRHVLVTTGYMTQLLHRLLIEKPDLVPEISLFDIFHINGFDETALSRILRGASSILVAQEAVRDGGLDSRIRRICDDSSLNTPIYTHAISSGYQFDIGKRDSIHNKYGVGYHDIFTTLQNQIAISEIDS